MLKVEPRHESDEALNYVTQAEKGADDWWALPYGWQLVILNFIFIHEYFFYFQYNCRFFLPAHR